VEVSALKPTAAPALRGPSPLLRLQSDERLIALTRRGHHAAFETLFARYHSRLLAFCRHMLASREDAEDVLQEVFAAAFNAVLADERAINVRPWLYRIARNRSLNHLRRASAIGVDSMDVHYADHGLSTDGQVLRRESFRQLIDDVQRLPETQRTALLLREIDALSYEQIAHAMDTTVPSVKSLLVRARISLAEAAEARQLTCEEVRTELGEVAEGLRKSSPPVRRHLRDCERCREFRQLLRSNNHALAAVLPIGPLAALRHLVLSKFGASAGAGHAAGAGAGAGAAGSGGAGAAGAGSLVVGAGAGAGVAGGASAAAGGAGLGGFVTAGAGAIATKAAATLAAAALVTAGAVAAERAVHHTAHHPTPVAAAAVAPRAPLVVRSTPQPLTVAVNVPARVTLPARPALRPAARRRAGEGHAGAAGQRVPPTGSTPPPVKPAGAPAATQPVAQPEASQPASGVQVTTETTQLPPAASAPAAASPGVEAPPATSGPTTTGTTPPAGEPVPGVPSEPAASTPTGGSEAAGAGPGEPAPDPTEAPDPVAAGEAPAQ
jgi:RNA polymerase sigma factor (sigma-70 family)